MNDSIANADYACFNINGTKRVHFEGAKAISLNNGVLLHYGQIQCRRQDSSICAHSRDRLGCEMLSLHAFAKRLSSLQSSKDIINLLRNMIGAWALVYYRYDLNEVFVGRDVFGRKSLLWTRDGDEILIAQFAVKLKLAWSLIPSGTITVLKLNSNGNILSNATIYTAIESDGEQPLWIQQFADPEIVLLSDIMANVLVTSKDPPKNEPNESELDEISDEMVQRLIASIMRNLDDMTTFVHETHPSVTLLFSGGVDSLLLAHLLHKCIDPSMCIDLINVSFDQNSKDFSGAPDRVRGIEAYKHLRECYPSREFRLILVNVDRDELADCRRRHIARLVRPSETVLDDSIACVLWFAARAEGVLYANTAMPPESLKHNSNSQVDRVKSESKVVIVGSGADELFGGYSRHRGCYENAGRLAAIDEMQRELIRIGERNLGRDDRIISAHSKDVRAPYLDDLFVEWVNCLPLELKSDFTKMRGVGEKALIRRALKHFGAPRTLFAAPKRAMQFGTRIAKLEERKEKGSDRCSRLVVNDSDAILVVNIANTN